MFEVKKFSVLITMLLVVFSVSAAFVWQPAVQVRAGGLFCVPTDEYLIIENHPVRFSKAIEADIEPVSFTLDSGLKLSLGATADYSTESEAVNMKFLKSYLAVGPEFSVSKPVSDNVSLGGSARFMFAWFTPLYEKFAYLDFSLFGSYCVLKSDSMIVDAVVPLSFRYKNDAVSFTLGAGMKVSYDFSAVKSE